ncbi:hypothetical protein [Dyella psychrodurans]|uniref:Uncharacterized protein n=1 Tax=Dyella psychrodurans TaxID=1927960 RepID=A0A370XBX0_9GAMM|nr:hypothetical protein [Dyella psychrodurans]RDS85899.1 hypothetical protein DWU99_01075 [Dyella psychrodurans]
MNFRPMFDLMPHVTRRQQRERVLQEAAPEAQIAAAWQDVGDALWQALAGCHGGDRQRLVRSVRRGITKDRAHSAP